MTCPKCMNDLRWLEHPVAGYCRCTECGGAWVDAKALRVRVEDLEPIRKAAAKGKPTGLYCPHCRTKELSAVDVAHRELDVCLACDGVFFDAGEFGLIAARLRRRNDKGPPPGSEEDEPHVLLDIAAEIGSFFVH